MPVPKPTLIEDARPSEERKRESERGRKKPRWLSSKFWFGGPVWIEIQTKGQDTRGGKKLQGLVAVGAGPRAEKEGNAIDSRAALCPTIFLQVSVI